MYIYIEKRGKIKREKGDFSQFQTQDYAHTCNSSTNQGFVGIYLFIINT